MADNRKYYYLKLKENFFDSDSIVLLEDMKDGILYSNILLKLYLKSLKNGGKLQLDEHIPYTAQMIATLTRHQIGTVERALEIFRQLGLVEQLDSGAFYMTDIELMIGQSSTEAERKRAARLENKALLPPRTKGGHLSDIRPPEIEIELDKELEQDLKLDINKEYIVEGTSPNEQSSSFTFPTWLEETAIKDLEKTKHKELWIPIVYLNQVANKRYKFVDKTKRLLLARFKEGYTLEDFKQVIDIKTAEWKDSPEFSKYLRPETLFGTKFDGYLNQKPKTIKGKSEDNFPDLPF